MNDNARLISLVLHDVKRKLHEVQVDPKIKGIDPYVSIKTVDAVINNCIHKYSEVAPKDNKEDDHHG